MPTDSWNQLLRYLRRVTDPDCAQVGDGQLIERFLAERDEAAFTALVRRHGPMVYALCRRLLHNEHDAEDAFQATFLVLARKAASVRRHRSLGGWLHEVAYHLALRAKTSAAKRQKREQEERPMTPVDDPALEAERRELLALLDEELRQLPSKYREALILCYLEGKTNEQAAEQLGWPLGSMSRRLARGRELLRLRLLRRGVTLSLAALTTQTALAAPLIRSVAHAALAFVNPSASVVVSPRVVELAEGVLKSMFATKLKIVAAMVLAAGIAAGALTHGLTASPQTEPRAEKPAAKPKEDRKEEAKPLSVGVVKPKKGGSPLMVLQTADVVAAQQQQIVPLVSGTVKEVRVDIGDRVKKGQVLLVLDAPLLAKEGEQATSAFEMAQAEEQEAGARVMIAEAEMQTAEAVCKGKLTEKEAKVAELTNWKVELGRSQKLEKNKVIDSATLDDTKRAVHVAEAAVAAAEAVFAAARADVKVKEGKLLHAKAAMKAAHAAVRTAHAVMDKARIQEGFTQLTAACDGVVTRRTIDPGNYVEASDSRVLRPLLTVQRLDVVRLVVQVNSAHAPLVKRGMPVEIDMPGMPKGEYKVSRFSPALEGGAREMTVEIDVPNADNRLLPGMVGKVQMPLQETAKNSLIVPAACLLPKAGTRILDPMKVPSWWVYIVRDGKAYEKAVTINFNDGRNAEIADGIQASDDIISNIAPVVKKAQGELRDGTPVKIEKTP